jgi:hypothetical protein
MTAKLRAGMRLKWHNNALTLLRHGEARAEVARSVILSPSRISHIGDVQGSDLSDQESPVE